MKCGALRFFYKGVLSVFSDFQAIRWRMCYPLNNHHHIDWSLYTLTKTVVKYISLYHNQKKHIYKIILSDYKLNYILNKQSLLFETLSSNGYVLYVRCSYLHGQMVWHSTLVESLRFKSTWRSNKNRQKLLLLTLNTLTCSNYVSF